MDLGKLVKPLVWEGKESDCFLSCDLDGHGYELCVTDTLDRPCDYVWSAAYTERGVRDINIGHGTLDEAKAIANADHAARVIAALDGDALLELLAMFAASSPPFVEFSGMWHEWDQRKRAIFAKLSPAQEKTDD